MLETMPAAGWCRPGAVGAQEVDGAATGGGDDAGRGVGERGAGEGDRVGRVVVGDVDGGAFDEGGGDGVDGVLGGDPAATAAGRGGPAAVGAQVVGRGAGGGGDDPGRRGGEQRHGQGAVGRQVTATGERCGRGDRRRLVGLQVEGRLLCCGDRFGGVGGVVDVAESDVGLVQVEVGFVFGGGRGDPHPDLALNHRVRPRGQGGDSGQVGVERLFGGEVGRPVR